MSTTNQELIEAISAILSQLKANDLSEIDVTFGWPVLSNNPKPVRIRAKR